MGPGRGNDGVLVEAREACLVGGAAGGAGCGAGEGWAGGGDVVAVGHVWRDGLGGVARDGAEVYGGDGDVHVGGGGAEAVGLALARAAEVGGEGLGAVHGAWGEGHCGCGARGAGRGDGEFGEVAEVGEGVGGLGGVLEGGGEGGEHLVWWGGGFLGGPVLLDVLEVKELLDVVLGVARGEGGELLRVEVREGGDLAGAEEVGGGDDGGLGFGEGAHGLGCEGVAWVAGDEDHAAVWADGVTHLELLDEALLLLIARAVLALGALVRLGHELLDADDGDGLEW